ncbi:MAG: hypothetical protein HY000_40005 [Planctomycetes bacterium]|nr:hypothetical protein [Planctomycetota bacterium]
MSMTEQIVTKLSALNEAQQREVLEFIATLECKPKAPLMDPYGMCSDLRTDMPFEEFQENRQEMWGQATNKEL